MIYFPLRDSEGDDVGLFAAFIATIVKLCEPDVDELQAFELAMARLEIVEDLDYLTLKEIVDDILLPGDFDSEEDVWN